MLILAIIFRTAKLHLLACNHLEAGDGLENMSADDWLKIQQSTSGVYINLYPKHPVVYLPTFTLQNYLVLLSG